MPRRQNFVTYYSPGTMFDEATTKAIETWDAPMAVRMSKGVSERYGATPYGFRFSTRIVADDVPDGEGGKLNVESKEVATSSLHHLGGTVLSYDEVRARGDKKDSILLSNMSCNDIAFVVDNRNSYRSTHPFEEPDAVVDDRGQVVERGDSDERKAYRTEFKARKERGEL